MKKEPETGGKIKRRFFLLLRFSQYRFTMFRRLINHHRAIFIMNGLTESPSSRTHRSFSGRKQPLRDCFFTAIKIKTNPLPLATKDLSERWTFLAIKKFRKNFELFAFFKVSYHLKLFSWLQQSRGIHALSDRVDQTPRVWGCITTGQYSGTTKNTRFIGSNSRVKSERIQNMSGI